VADTLIRSLDDTYDVEISEDPTFAAEPMHERNDVIRAVRLTPRAEDAARLTFADEMEWQVRAVVAGRYREYKRWGPTDRTSLRAVDGSGGMSGESLAAGLPTKLPAERLAAATDRLAAVPLAWAPWKQRAL
jgi:hypothetical protein